MWGFLLKLLPSAAGIFSRARDSADLREKDTSEEQQALIQAVAVENAKPSTTWWDSLVDGINRLVRPLFTFGTLALFVWACLDPISFSAAMTALALVPDALWVILGSIIVFWFGGRALEGIKGSPIDTAKVAQVVQTVQQIQAMRDPAPVSQPTAAQQQDIARRAAEASDSGKPISDDEYKHEMVDTSKPLSLQAIEEWNRRKKAGQ